MRELSPLYPRCISAATKSQPPRSTTAYPRCRLGSGYWGGSQGVALLTHHMPQLLEGWEGVLSRGVESGLCLLPQCEAGQRAWPQRWPLAHQSLRSCMQCGPPAWEIKRKNIRVKNVHRPQWLLPCGEVFSEGTTWVCLGIETQECMYHANSQAIISFDRLSFVGVLYLFAGRLRCWRGLNATAIEGYGIIDWTFLLFLRIDNEMWSMYNWPFSEFTSWVCVCVCVCVNTCIYVCMYIFLYVYLHGYVYVYMYLCVGICSMHSSMSGYTYWSLSTNDMHPYGKGCIKRNKHELFYVQHWLIAQE